MATEITKAQPATGGEDPFAPSTVGLLGILRILFRWSFIVAPLAALTVWFAFSQSEGIDPDHNAEASLLLVGPSELLIEDLESGEIIIEGLNPLQQLGGTLSTVARVTVLSMSDVSIAEQLADEGLTATYEIGAESRTPIIRMITTDVDQSMAIATVERLTELAIADLEQRQDALNAPETNRIGAQLISSGLSGGPDFTARSRMRLAIAAVGFMISGASAFFFEGLAELWRRRSRRKEAVQVATDRRALPSGQATDRDTSTNYFGDLASNDGATLIKVLHLITGNQEVAERLAKDTFQAADGLTWSASDPDPIVWLYREAIGRAWTNPQRDAVVSHPVDDELWASVHELPDETRAAVALTHIAGFGHARIAQILDITEDDVIRHYERAERGLDTSTAAEDNKEATPSAAENTGAGDDDTDDAADAVASEDADAEPDAAPTLTPDPAPTGKAAANKPNASKKSDSSKKSDASNKADSSKKSALPTADTAPSQNGTSGRTRAEKSR